MGDKQHVVKALQDYFATFSQKRVSTQVLQSEEQCEALADIVLAGVDTPSPTNWEFDYWIEHTMTNGETYRSTNLSQANIATPAGRGQVARNQKMPLDLFETVMLQQIRAKGNVVTIKLVRSPIIDRPMREVVKSYPL